MRAKPRRPRNPGKPRIRSLEAVRRALQIGASTELGRLEQWLVWLATTGAVTPFVGLFGTVWGIIDAFHGLATAGTATLHSVAPGIAEALITTAAGRPAAVVIRASAMPGATLCKVAVPAVARP